jgi:hypothetical protein
MKLGRGDDAVRLRSMEDVLAQFIHNIGLLMIGLALAFGIPLAIFIFFPKLHPLVGCLVCLSILVAWFFCLIVIGSMIQN